MCNSLFQNVQAQSGGLFHAPEQNGEYLIQTITTAAFCNKRDSQTSLIT